VPTFAALRSASPWFMPSQTAAASSNVMPAGMGARKPVSRTQTYSACAPLLMPNTRSPTAKSVTAEPTASTSPASSRPRILRFGRRSPSMKRQMNGLARRMWQSVWLTVVARIRTRTSSSLGTGRSTSSMRSTSGGPYLSWTTALIVFAFTPLLLRRCG